MAAVPYVYCRPSADVRCSCTYFFAAAPYVYCRSSADVRSSCTSLAAAPYVYGRSSADIRSSCDDALAPRDADLDRIKGIISNLGKEPGDRAPSFSSKENSGCGVTHCAACLGDLQVCMYLVEELKDDVNMPSSDSDGVPLLRCSALSGDTSTVKYFLDHGDGILKADENGFPVLDHAVCAEFLLSKGIPVDIDYGIGTPLSNASLYEKDKAVQILLDHHGNPNSVFSSLGGLLKGALVHRSLKCMKLLIKSGADVKGRGSIMSPLLIANEVGGYTNFIQLLLKAGADPNVRDDLRRLPMQLAALKDCREEVEMLLSLTSPTPNLPNWSVNGVISHAKLASAKPMNETQIEERKDFLRSQADKAFKQKEYDVAPKTYSTEYKEACDAFIDAHNLDPANEEIERELTEDTFETNRTLWEKISFPGSNLRRNGKSKLKKFLGCMTTKRMFSSGTDFHGVRNTVTFSLNGNKLQVLRSFIKAIVHFRLWNMCRGVCLDLSSLFGFEQKIYTVRDKDSFHFIVTYDGEYIDLVLDGRESWFYGWLTPDGVFEFKLANGRRSYINHKDRRTLDFTGHYDFIAPDRSPGKIEMGLDSIIEAFKELRFCNGESTMALQHAVGRFVLLLGESSKFHRVFQCWCDAIMGKGATSLDNFDKSLGVMVKKWGKLCEEVADILSQWLGDSSKDAESISALLHQEMEKIVKKKVPGIVSVQDVLDNVCLFTRGCLNVKEQLQHFKVQKEPKSPVWSPVDPLYRAAEPDEIITSYQKRIYGKQNQAELGNKMACLGPSAGGPPHQAVDEFVERQGSQLFRASAWRSKIPVHHYGPLITRSTLSNKRNILSNTRQYSTMKIAQSAMETSSVVTGQKEGNRVLRSFKTFGTSKLFRTAANTILKNLKR